MTRDEARAKCIAALGLELARIYGVGAESLQDFLDDATEVFDALHGIARVCPIEATEDMVEAGAHATGLWANLWRAMSATGDLTNATESKP